MVYSDLRIGAAGDRIHADDRLYSGDRGSGADGGNHVEEGVSVALLALVLFAGIRERLELEDVPKAVQGVPVALITAGILAMAFMGFSGLV